MFLTVARGCDLFFFFDEDVETSSDIALECEFKDMSSKLMLPLLPLLWREEPLELLLELLWLDPLSRLNVNVLLFS